MSNVWNMALCSINMETEPPPEWMRVAVHESEWGRVRGILMVIADLLFPGYDPSDITPAMLRDRLTTLNLGRVLGEQPGMAKPVVEVEPRLIDKGKVPPGCFLVLYQTRPEELSLHCANCRIEMIKHERKDGFVYHCHSCQYTVHSIADFPHVVHSRTSTGTRVE